jgi:hypothetical protein
MSGNSTSQSSGLLVTAGLLLYTGKNIINGLSATPGNTITVYDNAAGTATGTVIAQIVNAGTSTIDFVPAVGIRCDNGISIVSAAGNGGIVYFGA